MNLTFAAKMRLSLCVLAATFMSCGAFAQSSQQLIHAPEEYMNDAGSPSASGSAVYAAAVPTASSTQSARVFQPNPYSAYAVPENNRKPPAEDRPIGVSTVSGFDLGLQFSGYKYREPGLDVTLKGYKFGVNAIATGVLPSNFFVIGDIRYARGNSDYSGSGSNYGRPEDLWDLRALAGRDFSLSSFGTAFDLSPYSGIGYRTLSSDDRGTSSTGARGYRRENQLIYLPVGVKPRFQVTSNARITSTFEYDYMITGEQTSKLSDANGGFPDLHNTQNAGNGFRGDIMWETKSWAAGTFINYWNINQSNTKCATGPVFIVCGDEPHNHTLEYGIQFRYHFF